MNNTDDATLFDLVLSYGAAVRRQDTDAAERWLREILQRGADGVQAVRECGNAECGWKGETSRMCGRVGPLCPDCGEVTEEVSTARGGNPEEAGEDAGAMPNATLRPAAGNPAINAGVNPCEAPSNPDDARQGYAGRQQEGG